MIAYNFQNVVFFLLTFYNRYSLRASTPIYGWWYYYMIYEGVGKCIGQFLPKFPPNTDEEVDQLMELKVRV